jgi:hypothetical protein
MASLRRRGGGAGKPGGQDQEPPWTAGPDHDPPSVTNAGADHDPPSVSNAGADQDPPRSLEITAPVVGAPTVNATVAISAAARRRVRVRVWDLIDEVFGGWGDRT